MTWQDLCRLGLSLPEVKEGTWYRTPALMVGGKGFVRLKEEGASVVFLLEDLEEQAFLLGAKPSVYFITDHYEGWPAVLARLSRLGAREARSRLEEAWRVKAPARLRKGEAVAPPAGRATRPPLSKKKARAR